MNTKFEIISTLQAKYIRCVDRDELEKWPDYFTEDCFYKVTTADNVKNKLPAGLIYAKSKNMLKDRISALREANIYEAHTYRHIIGSPIIEEKAEGVIAETPFFVLRIMHDGKTEIFASGVYEDIYEFDGEQALIKERIVICDSDQIDTLLAIPI
jgi:anthranilate 1,2-dioxygenase small subunit